MKVLSRDYDKRINSWNLYIDTTFGEYLAYAKKLTGNNTLQRKKVRSSKTVYSLLKEDIIKGCIMPPLVLAIQESKLNPETIQDDDLKTFIEEHTDQILILDGLQRTYTLIDAEGEAKDSKGVNYEEFIKSPLRIELYLNINRFGVLYRMLTLNTGQTPMSTRHQLEMLYRDFLDQEFDGVKLVTDTQGRSNAESREFNFSDVITGFNSYTNRDEKPIDRQDILDNIRMMENMSKEDVQQDIFKRFIETYVKVFNRIADCSNGYELTEEVKEEYQISGSVFGKNAIKIFSTSQAMTGFGSAIGKMKDRGLISGLDEIADLADKIDAEDTEWIPLINSKLDIIRNQSKKIGNAQRLYFHFIFRSLFNHEAESFLNLKDSVEAGYHFYEGQIY